MRLVDESDFETFIGVDLATGPDRSILTAVKVRVRPDGVRVIEVITHRVVAPPAQQEEFDQQKGLPR